MRRRAAAYVFALTLFSVLFALPAFAHDVSGSAVYLDMGSSSIGLELHVPLSQLYLARELPAPSAWSAASDPRLPAYLREHVSARTADGTPLLL